MEQNHNTYPIIKSSFTRDSLPYHFYIGLHGERESEIKIDAELRSLHTHHGFEIGGVVSGEGKLYLDGRIFDLKPGDVFFLDCSMPHNTAGPKLKEYIAHVTIESVINAHADLGDMHMIEPFFTLRYGLSPIIPEARAIISLLKKAWLPGRTDPPYGRQTAWFRIIEVLTLIARYIATNKISLIDRKGILNSNRLARAIGFFVHNYCRNFPLSEIAGQLSMSESRFSHFFKEHVGMTPLQYRDMLRVSNALRKIILTDSKLSVIAMETGFNSLSQFYSTIKKATGKTPSALRSSAK